MSADAPTFMPPGGGAPSTAAESITVTAPPALDLPPVPPPPPAETAPGKAKRPTTRAGRKAAAAARGAKSPGRESAPKSTPTPRKASLETRLAGSLSSLGLVVAATGAAVSPAIQADGILIVSQSADIAKALDKVAQDQPQVKAALERALTAGVWSGLIAALLPLVVGIAANHGAIPPHLAAMLGAPVETPEATAGG